MTSKVARERSWDAKICASLSMRMFEKDIVLAFCTASACTHSRCRPPLGPHPSLNDIEIPPPPPPVPPYPPHLRRRTLRAWTEYSARRRRAAAVISRAERTLEILEEERSGRAFAKWKALTVKRTQRTADVSSACARLRLVQCRAGVGDLGWMGAGGLGEERCSVSLVLQIRNGSSDTRLCKARVT